MVFRFLFWALRFDFDKELNGEIVDGRRERENIVPTVVPAECML